MMVSHCFISPHPVVKLLLHAWPPSDQEQGPEPSDVQSGWGISFGDRSRGHVGEAGPGRCRHRSEDRKGPVAVWNSCVSVLQLEGGLDAPAGWEGPVLQPGLQQVRNLPCREPCRSAVCPSWTSPRAPTMTAALRRVSGCPSPALSPGRPVGWAAPGPSREVEKGSGRGATGGSLLLPKGICTRGWGRGPC